MLPRSEKTILIMDDDLGIQRVLSHFLQEDFTIVIRNDGMEGMQWLEENENPDMIIADLNMPNLDGLSFLKTIRASNFYKDIPLIILSGEEDSGEHIKCLDLGADDFITKPFNPLEVKARVNAILRRRN